MDEEKEEHQGVDYFGPGIVLAFIVAFTGDLGSLLAFGAVIPVIGLVFLAAGLLAHYTAGIFVAGLVLFELKHFIPKAVLAAAILLPFPLFIIPIPSLVLGIIAALILQNRLIEQLAIQAAAMAATAATGAGGAAIEAANAARVGAQAATAAARAERAAAAATRAGARGAAAEGRGAETLEERAVRYKKRMERFAQGGEEEGEGGEEGGEEPEIPEEELGVEAGPLEQLRRSMEEFPKVEAPREEEGEPRPPKISERKFPERRAGNPQRQNPGNDIISP